MGRVAFWEGFFAVCGEFGGLFWKVPPWGAILGGPDLTLGVVGALRFVSAIATLGVGSSLEEDEGDPPIGTFVVSVNAAIGTTCADP